jgi:hypothetical protein
MNDDTLAASTAPEPDATAAPVPETTTPEGQTTDKTFSQEQRKWEREQAQRLAETQARAPVAPPAADDFESASAYADALADQRAQELLNKREAAKAQAELLDAYHDREEEARSKYDDFEQVAYNPKLPVTDAMAQTIQASEIGPDVIYWLGSNPKEAARISALPGLLQAREIGKIEAKLATNPPVKRTSTAPAPIAPVAARASGSPAYDTTDPRSTKTMSTSEWIEADRLRQIKKLESLRR